MKKAVEFPNLELTMAGELYLSANFEETKRYSALLCIHPGGGVKEQTIGLYAGKLAERGFLALTFDASRQGESGGVCRGLEDPAARVEDVRCAADFLSTLPYVDQNRIGVLGICAGGGYAVNAALTEKRIQAVGTVSAVDVGAFFRGDGSPESREASLATLRSVAAQRSAEANGAETGFMTWVPDTTEEAAASPMTLQREGYEYYRTDRGRHCNSANRLPLRSVDKLMAFSAFGLVPQLLDKPLLCVAGSKADTLGFSETVVSLSNGPKELFLVEGATHVALYDVDEYVEQAVEKLAVFYENNL